MKVTLELNLGVDYIQRICGENSWMVNLMLKHTCVMTDKDSFPNNKKKKGNISFSHHDKNSTFFTEKKIRSLADLL